MATKRTRNRAPRLEEYVGRSKRARAYRERLAEQMNVDEDTVHRWAKGEETIPDDVIAWLHERLGCRWASS